MMMLAFGLLSLLVLRIVKSTKLFEGITAVVASLLIAAIAITACALLLLIPNNPPEAEHMQNIRVNFSLLPLMIFAGLMLMLQLFITAAVIVPDKSEKVLTTETALPTTKSKSTAGRPKKDAKGSEHSPAKPKSRGRPKKKEPERSSDPIKNGGKGKSDTEVSNLFEGTVTN